MLNGQEVRAAHEKAQAVYPDGLVLLGGSYWQGTANENSDLDLYVVSNWWNFLVYARDEQRARQVKEVCPIAKIMFVPLALWTRGYYAISGVNLRGKVRCSPLNWHFIFRNALKLGYLYYLRSRLGDFDYWLEKTNRQIEKLKLAAKELKGVSPKAMGHLAILDELAESVGEQKRFSWLNHLVYNLYFLRFNCWRFFFTNPDWLVFRCLHAIAHQPRIDEEAVNDMGKCAFIVLIR